jgi:hypothetical protein
MRKASFLMFLAAFMPLSKTLPRPLRQRQFVLFTPQAERAPLDGSHPHDVHRVFGSPTQLYLDRRQSPVQIKL